MAFRMVEIALLRLSDPDKWRARMNASIDKHGGVVSHVAQDLGIGHATVKRWIDADDDLKSYVDEARKKEARRLAQGGQAEPAPKPKAPTKPPPRRARRVRKPEPKLAGKSGARRIRRKKAA